jgi:hypothetical protein
MAKRGELAALRAEVRRLEEENARLRSERASHACAAVPAHPIPGLIPTVTAGAAGCAAPSSLIVFDTAAGRPPLVIRDCHFTMGRDGAGGTGNLTFPAGAR